MCYMWQKIRTGVRWNPKELAALAARAVNLADVKSITVSFDPFHPENETIRQFWHVVNGPKVKLTNYKCSILPNIRNDRQPPYFEAKLANGHRLVFKTERMTLMDILITFNRLTGQPLFGKPGEKAMWAAAGDKSTAATSATTLTKKTAGGKK